MEIFFDQDLCRRNKELVEQEQPKLKMRNFMDLGKQAWADLNEDDKMPFIERYKELCNTAGVEPKLEVTHDADPSHTQKHILVAVRH